MCGRFAINSETNEYLENLVAANGFQALEHSGARVYIEGVDVARQRARGYPNPTPARELAFSHLFERINDCCFSDEPQVKVVADEHHTALRP